MMIIYPDEGPLMARLYPYSPDAESPERAKFTFAVRQLAVMRPVAQKLNAANRRLGQVSLPPSMDI